MGHYLGGAPLVTRERNILSNVPWIVAGRQWDRTRWSRADSVVLLLAGTRGCLATYALGAELGIARCVVWVLGHVRAGRGTEHRYEARTCGWSIGEAMVHMEIMHGAFGINALFSGKIVRVGFWVNHFLGKCFTDILGQNGILACVGKLSFSGKMMSCGKMHISSCACMLVAFNAFYITLLFGVILTCDTILW